MAQDEPPVEDKLWQIVAAGRLSLRGSRLCIELCRGEYPFHVHRYGDDGKAHACFGCADDLRSAKGLAMEAYRELTEMGVEP